MISNVAKFLEVCFSQTKSIQYPAYLNLWFRVFSHNRHDIYNEVWACLLPGSPPLARADDRQPRLQLRQLRPVGRRHVGHDDVQGRAVHLLGGDGADYDADKERDQSDQH